MRRRLMHVSFQLLGIIRRDADFYAICSSYVGMPPAVHRADRFPDRVPTVEETAAYTR